MLRPAFLPALLLLTALGLLGVGVRALLQRDRAALVDGFARDHTAGLEAACRTVADDLEDLGEDLRLAAELLARPGTRSEHERELSALLEVVGQYKALAVLGPDGAVRSLLVDRRAALSVPPPVLRATMADTAALALAQPPGLLVTSPPLEGQLGPWRRVFATAVPGEGAGWAAAVAVLVDVEPLVAPFRLLAAQPDTRLLLLGAHGRPTPASDPALAERLERGEEAPALTALARRMRAGERGVMRLSDAEAEELGLGPAEAIAAFAPIPVKGGSHWSVATLSSTTALRAHERSLLWRMAGAGAAGSLLLLAFGAHLLVASRRAVALRESRRHAERLAALHARTQQMLDHIPTGVMALTADGRLSALNRPLRERMPEGALGGTLHEALPQAPAAVVAQLTGLVEDACRAGRVLTLQGEALSLFGKVGQYRISAIPFPPQEDPVRALLVVEDLSDVKALESQLMHAEKLATVGVLAAGIAHEVGTPLGIVRGRAEYVLGKLGPGHPQGPGVQVIIDQIDHVSRTLRQLLDFSRVQPAAVRPVSLPAVLGAVHELMRVEAARRRIRLGVEVEEGLPLLAADPDQLQQVLVNLTLNACDACSAGGAVRLVAERTPAERVRLVVEDDGCGIPPEHLHQVFDPFFTTKKRGQGTGLGLTLVAQVVRNHGGTVELDSTPGRGTRVVLLWPTAPFLTRGAA